MWPCLFHAPGQSLGNPCRVVSGFLLPRAAAYYTHVKQSLSVLLSSGSLTCVMPACTLSPVAKRLLSHLNMGTAALA